ncbi:AMP-binding protein [Desulfofundulus thermobenzoicus]|uniref:AMP-binding protein n=1 Tax=Desulfofundulus thermobenzoicus TaxID=29376 RepID=A0A6N7IR33_9FIRM|nr:AMP-binding protein [Desulfofundulus thermobenzoicus]MQL52514.1 AMP-binding protein [Desulfofundulus thermobenzoicus]
MVFYGKKISYRELGNHIDGLAGALKQLGGGPEDRVALLLSNCPQYVIAYCAVLQLGAVVAPVNPLSTERELTHIVQDAGIRLAVELNLLVGRLENVRAALRSGGSTLLEQIICAFMPEFLPLLSP